MTNILYLLIFLGFSVPLNGYAQSYFNMESGSTWQTRNDQAVPGSGGTRFSLDDFKGGPFLTYRLYVGHQWDQRHEVRFLYAPLAIELKGRLKKETTFVDSVFSSETETQSFYKFNSYRFTYAYHFSEDQAWDWAIGFTGKIRDAEVRLRQGGLMRRKANVGFVPLFHFQGRRSFFDSWYFRLDFDGLVAPQGRAIDFAFFLEKKIPETQAFLFAGYRTVEGGADNERVYNFAWFNSLTLGLRAAF